MSHPLRRWTSVLVCALVLCVACATIAPKPLPPQLNLDTMRITRFEPFDTRLVIALIAHNPNSYDVTVNELEATLAVNDERLLTGTLTSPATLKADADTPLEIEVRTDFVAMANVLQKVTHEGSLRYDFAGSAMLKDGLRLPFNRKGEVAARDFLGPKS